MKRRITLDERAEILSDVTRKCGVRLDANETMMFSRQLEYIETQLFEVKYPQGHAIEIIPLKTNIDPGATKYTYRAKDYVGAAKRISNFATDFPRVDMQGKEVEHKLQNYGASYGFDLQQLRSAQFAKFQLESNLNTAAREVVMRKLDENLWFGDTEIGVYGFANSTLVSPTAVITGAWSAATADEILDDAQKLINAASAASNGVENTNAVAFPVSLWNIISKKFMGAAAPGVTVLEMLKKANPGVAFYNSYRLELADAAGTGPRIVAFTASETHVFGLVPTEFEVLPAVDQGGQFEVKCMGRFGGVATPYPAALNYMDDC